MAVTDIHHMTLSGGAACLDLVNSGFDVERAVKTERIHNYGDLLVLAGRLKLIDAGELSSLEKFARSNREAAAGSLQRVLAARDILHEMFSAIAQGKAGELNNKTVSAFNSYRAIAVAALEYDVEDNHVSLRWRNAGKETDQPLWGFILSADELLKNGDLRYIKECSGCSWLFYDQSKNHRRKWCDMQTCGSSAKAKRYYQRKKAT